MKKVLVLLTLIISSHCFSQTLEDTQLYKDEKLLEERKEKYEKLLEEVRHEDSVKQFVKGDTLFVYFKKSNVTHKLKFKSLEFKNVKDSSIRYIFKLKDTKEEKFSFLGFNDETITFYYKKYEDFDAMSEDRASIVKKVSHDFFEERGQTVFTERFITQNKDKTAGYVNLMVREILHSKKIIFLIDEEEKGIMREVKIAREETVCGTNSYSKPIQKYRQQ